MTNNSAQTIFQCAFCAFFMCSPGVTGPLGI